MTAARCCVIGGAGFIGAHVTRLLAGQDREVLVIGRREHPAAPLPRNVRYLAADYRDPLVIRSSLARMDAVVDLAYATVPKTSFDDPIFDIVSNLPPSVQLLREAINAAVGRVVVVSSGGTVYGIAEALPIAEGHPTNPISPYGITKLTIEKYAGMYAVAAGLPVVVVRPANAYGEGQPGTSGQGFVAAAIHAVTGRRPVIVFGSGKTVRDYVHVTDVASGIVAALDHGVAGEAYNVGTGVGTSVEEVVDRIRPLAASHGLPVEVERRPERGFDVPANVLDSTKLATAAGWRAQVAFEDGLGRAWRSVVDNATA